MYIAIVLYWFLNLFQKPQGKVQTTHRVLKNKPDPMLIQRYLKYIKKRFPQARDWTYDFKGDYIYIKSLNPELAYGLREFFGGSIRQNCFVMCATL